MEDYRVTGVAAAYSHRHAVGYEARATALALTRLGTSMACSVSSLVRYKGRFNGRWKNINRTV